MMNTTMAATDTPTALHARSPAKINLALRILGKRDDGFHEIRSLVSGVELFDRLTFRRTDSDPVALRCDDKSLPVDDANLVIRAAHLLRERTGAEWSTSIELEKNIPVAAGMGGGSGNAAVTLTALNRIWKTDFSDDALAEMGAEIGSDVPLFFHLPTAEISGRGEIVAPVSMAWQGWVLLVFAGCTVSTPEVYRHSKSADWSGQNESVFAELKSATTASEVSALCFNDLERSVFRVAPRVEEMCSAIRSAGAKQVRVTGAGQTAFVLFDDPGEAEDLRRRLIASGIGSEACVVRVLQASEMMK